jgi:hypothetical protein
MRFSGLTLSELRAGVSLSNHPLDIYLHISYQRTSRGFAASPISTHHWFILENFNFQTHRTGRFFASPFKERPEPQRFSVFLVTKAGPICYFKKFRIPSQYWSLFFLTFSTFIYPVFYCSLEMKFGRFSPNFNFFHLKYS